MKNYLIVLFVIITIPILVLSSCKKDDASNGDGIKPEIVIIGQSTMYWALDIPYIDAGAIAYDVIAPGDTTDLTSSIAVENNVDVSVIGDYSVKYNVKDASGESAEEKTRIVKVVLGK